MQAGSYSAVSFLSASLPVMWATLSLLANLCVSIWKRLCHLWPQTQSGGSGEDTLCVKLLQGRLEQSQIVGMHTHTFKRECSQCMGIFFRASRALYLQSKVTVLSSLQWYEVEGK